MKELLSPVGPAKHAEVGDALLWLVQDGKIKLALDFVKTSKTAPFDIDVFPTHQKVMTRPREATRIDIARLFFGMQPIQRRAKHSAPDNEFQLPGFHAPDLAGVDRNDAHDEFIANKKRDIAAELLVRRKPTRTPLAYTDLLPWQRSFVDVLRHGGDQRDRQVHWLWNARGSVGKSTASLPAAPTVGHTAVPANPFMCLPPVRTCPPFPSAHATDTVPIGHATRRRYAQCVPHRPPRRAAHHIGQGERRAQRHLQ